MTYKVIFTDIDGTLIDINTGEYRGTKELVRILKKIIFQLFFVLRKLAPNKIR